MRLLQAIGIVLLAFGIVGLVLLSIYLFEWIAFIVWMIVIFIGLVIAVYHNFFLGGVR